METFQCLTVFSFALLCPSNDQYEYFQSHVSWTSLLESLGIVTVSIHQPLMRLNHPWTLEVSSISNFMNNQENPHSCCTCSCLLLLLHPMQPLQQSRDRVDFYCSVHMLQVSLKKWLAIALCMSFSICMRHNLLQAKIITFKGRRTQCTCHCVWCWIFFQRLSNKMSITICFS